MGAGRRVEQIKYFLLQKGQNGYKKESRNQLELPYCLN
jgi:hypothetical protein